METALQLYEAKRYPEAETAFQAIVTAEPKNAAACHHLGRTLERRAGPDSLPTAVKWLRQAAELEPRNPVYLARYGGASLLLAEQTSSFAAAWRGREALESALVLDPDDLDAREGLFHFYQRAPWPLGSTAKATRHLAEIRQRDPIRATVVGILDRTNVRDYAGAFRLCEEALAIDPGNYNALYQYGRTAALSGEHLAVGLSRLHACLALKPPTEVSPSTSAVWQRIGQIHELRRHSAPARAAYEKALQLDPGNREAASALARLKSEARHVIVPASHPA